MKQLIASDKIIVFCKYCLNIWYLRQTHAFIALTNIGFYWNIPCIIYQPSRLKRSHHRHHMQFKSVDLICTCGFVLKIINQRIPSLIQNYFHVNHFQINFSCVSTCVTCDFKFIFPPSKKRDIIFIISCVLCVKHKNKFPYVWEHGPPQNVTYWDFQDSSQFSPVKWNP